MACPDNQFEAVIGERRFSRVRPFDDEERKKEFSIPGCSRIKQAVGVQPMEKRSRRGREESIRTGEEKPCGGNKSVVQDRLRRKENELEAAKDWTEQHKERVAQEVADKLHRMQINDRYGPLTRDRYLQQDLEPARNTAIYNKLQESWCDQIDKKEERRKKDSTEHMEYVHMLCEARKNMREREEFIGRRLFEDNVELMNHQMVEAGWKAKEAREEKETNHKYQIKPEYFAQFQTRSR